MTTSPSDKPGPWRLDFNQPMRPRSRAYVKITHNREVTPSSLEWKTLYNPARLAMEPEDERLAKLDR